jgi:cation diffusion facilitator CzcD-associated flavoprotein CzcO
MVNPNMCTNLSRHTVSFSDMAWPEASPTFPKAWQVGQYLKRYTERYYGIDVKTSSKVVKAVRYPDVSLSKRWKIEVQRNKPDASVAAKPNSFSEADPSGEEDSKTSFDKVNGSIETYFFDYLIVASGFFGKPKFPYERSRFSGPVQYSTQFRSLQDLLKPNNGDLDTQGSKIVVVGGSMSGAEIAASIAMQLSSDIHSPGPAHINDASKYTVHHIVRRAFWVMPLFLPVKPLLSAQGDQSKVSRRFS